MSEQPQQHVPGAAPHTGDPSVDAALARLGVLVGPGPDEQGAPIERHPEIFDRLHRALQDRLADLED